jgi:hypothetical protein
VRPIRLLEARAAEVPGDAGLVAGLPRVGAGLLDAHERARLPLRAERSRQDLEQIAGDPFAGDLHRVARREKRQAVLGSAADRRMPESLQPVPTSVTPPPES